MPTALGSKVTVGGNTLNCSVVMNDQNIREVDNTNSSNSATNYDLVVPDNTLAIDIPWDNTNTPETVGFVVGTKITVIVFNGSTGKNGTLTNTLVKSHSKVRDNGNDIIRSKILCKGGTWSGDS